MKSLLCFVFLLSASVGSIAQNETAKQYPIKVHVSSSELRGSSNPDLQVLRVVIDGKKYQLIGLGSKPFALKVGDYQARIIMDRPIQAGQYERRYEIIFPDGKTTQYEVGGESE
jgi:hypothetical protein